MKRFASMVFLLAACAIALQGQAPLSVGYQKRMQIAVSGATAAYSLDSSIVEAGAANGLVEIVGKAPGATNIVVVTEAGVQTLAVNVPVPPPVLPPGFEPPRGNQGESGNYEFRYNSDPGQITNSVEFKRIQGESFDRVQVVNANLFSAGSSASAIGFPYLSYEISRPSVGLTFVDQTVGNSPFTLDGYLVRGFHLRAGQWQFHGGFTSIATFQNLFLATDREYVAGLSRSFKIDDKTSVQANVYYFRNPLSAQPAAANGAAATLVARYVDKDKAALLTEWGVGRGVAFAIRGRYDAERDHVSGNFRVQGRRFASLAVNNQHGVFANLDAAHKFSSRLYGSLDLNQSNFRLASLQQDTFTTSQLLNFRINRNFSLTSGSAFSTFQSKVPLGARISTLNLPVGVDFSSRHFGSGFQYQRAINLQGDSGNDYAVNLRASAGDFRGTAFFRHDVQVPTLAAIFSQIPGLQDALERAGIVANTPDQLADLLRNSALLATLGFAGPFTVNLAPARNDFGGSLTWISHTQRRRQLDLSYLNSRTELVRGNLLLSTITASYAQRLSASNNIVGSVALVHTSNNGQTDTRPLFSVSLQHRFSSVPALVLPGRHGAIEGHVFRDDDSTGLYRGQTTLGGVEVRLDGDRVTRTDSNGFYSFHHVPYGAHRIEPVFRSADPFFYTTDSPATTDINSTVDFGINFARGQVFGYLLNDAGAGVAGVTVELQGEEVQGKKLVRRVQTGDNGKFSFPGLPAGSYSVFTLPESYPPGYSLQDLVAHQVIVEPGKPASAEFTATAIRSVAGKVMAYDQATLRPVPVPGLAVRLQELSLQATTAENGAYLFRNLPAGTYTIAVESKGKQVTRTVVVPAEPASIRDIDLNVGPK